MVVTASLLDNSKLPIPQSTPDEHPSDAAMTWVVCGSHFHIRLPQVRQSQAKSGQIRPGWRLGQVRLA